MGTLLAASTAYKTGELLALLVLAALLIALIARLRRVDRGPRARLTDGIAALVVAVLLIGGVVRLGGGDGGDAWASGDGAEMKAGFIAGCKNTSGGMVDCTCAFEHIASQPPYDTPSGFATLEGPIMAAQRTGDLGHIPPQVVEAVQACARSTG